MTFTKLNEQELSTHFVGEGVTVATIMAIMCAALMAVVIYKLFLSSKGSTTIPGGWKITWENAN